MKNLDIEKIHKASVRKHALFFFHDIQVMESGQEKAERKFPLIELNVFVTDIHEISYRFLMCVNVKVGNDDNEAFGRVLKKYTKPRFGSDQIIDWENDFWYATHLLVFTFESSYIFKMYKEIKTGNNGIKISCTKYVEEYACKIWQCWGHIGGKFSESIFQSAQKN